MRGILVFWMKLRFLGAGVLVHDQSLMNQLKTFNLLRFSVLKLTPGLSVIGSAG